MGHLKKNDRGSHCRPRKQRARQPISCDLTSFVFFARKFLIYHAIVLFYRAINDIHTTFSTFLLVSRAFSRTPLAYKGRANYTEASWYLAASQAVITSHYRFVITLSTRDFRQQFVWLLPPIGGKATYFVFLCDHAIVTSFPSRDHI